MTREGYEQAQKKLDHLKNVEMPRVQKALGDAREMGDLSENAEFDAARNEMWTLDQTIGELETKLSLTDVIDASKLNLDTVAIGALLKIEVVDGGGTEEILLVGEGEIRTDVDAVSVTSPLGQAFIGKKVGELAEVQAPRGLVKYKVLEIKYG